MPRRFLLVAVVCLLASSAWSANEKVTNGGFETGSLGPEWQTQCFTPCTVDVVGGGVSDPSHPSHSGTYSLQAVGEAAITQILPPYTGINPGVFDGLITNDVHLWFSTPADLFAVELLYSGVTPVPCDASTGFLCIDVTSHGWTDYGQELIANIQTAGSGRFLTGIVIGTPSGATSYVDDVSIFANPTFNPQVPEPTSMLLLGSGLVALGWIPSLQPPSRKRR